MANIYVGGATANDSNSGASWALAKATIAGALAIATVNDTVVIDQDYNQSASVAVALTCPTTMGGAVRIETGIQTGSDPPQQWLYGAAISTTGASSTISITGNAWIVGLSLNTVGTSANVSIGAAASNDIFAFDIDVTMAGGGASQRLTLGTTATAAPGSITIHGLRVTLGSTSQQIVLGQSKIRIQGLLCTAGQRPTVMFSAVTQRALDAIIMDGTIERLSTTGAVLVMASGTGKLVLARVRMPNNWTGNLFNTAPTVRVPRVELHDCSDANGVRYDIEEDSFGRGIMTTAHTRTGGRDRSALINGRSGMCSFPACPFVYELEPVWNDTVGSEITISVPILADGAEPTDEEIAVRLSFPGDGVTAGSGSVLSTPNGLNISSTFFPSQTLNARFGASSGWTTSFANPKPRKIDIPITPGDAGYIKVEVLVYAARSFAVDAPVKL